MALGVFLSSFAPNLATFMLCYSFLFGAGVGLAYTAPMVNGWRWFPDKKGLVSGAVVAGFGAGGFVFNQVRPTFVSFVVLFLFCCKVRRKLTSCGGAEICARLKLKRKV